MAEQHSGVASSLLNTAQQVGGAIGLAVLGTVAWTTVADSVSAQVARAAADAAKRASSQRHCRPGLCNCMRTEPSSPPQFVLVGSASGHVITTWEKSAGTTPAPGLTTVQRPAGTTRFLARTCRGGQRAPSPPHANRFRQDNPMTIFGGWPGGCFGWW